LYGEFVTPPNKETVQKDPESPYAISKLGAEYYFAYYGRVHGLHTVALRFGNVYGPRQDPHGEAGVVAIFCGRILDGRPLTIFGDGRQTRDYVYVRDVAAATFAAASKALPPAERLTPARSTSGPASGRPDCAREHSATGLRHSRSDRIRAASTGRAAALGSERHESGGIARLDTVGDTA